MKSNLKVLLLSIGVLIASIATSIDTVLAQSATQTQVSSQWNIQQKNNHNLIAGRRRGNRARREREVNAFSRSDYDYWDARVLADYWGESVYEAKARIGRKILWGPENVAILEQFLVDARTLALQESRSASSPSAYKFYRESKYNYQDATDLARFWGDRTPTDAKLRIERNLILGNEEVIDRALRFARS